MLQGHFPDPLQELQVIVHAGGGGHVGIIVQGVALVRRQRQNDGLIQAGKGQVSGVALPIAGFQCQQDIPAVLQTGLGEAEVRLLKVVAAR